MKISASKKQLAKIISENGGWFDGANWAIQGRQTMGVGFSKSKPYRKGDGWFVNNEKRLHHFATNSVLPNWHQTIVSRDEYFHLYPAPDVDGWIEWSGGECPTHENQMVDTKHKDGRTELNRRSGEMWWDRRDRDGDIIAYRPRNQKKEQSKPWHAVIKPTIEQLAAEYRNHKDHAERKQREADEAKAEAEAKLAELVAAGKVVGLVVSVAAPEPELIITDIDGLIEGDVIELTAGERYNKTECTMVHIDGVGLRAKSASDTMNKWWNLDGPQDYEWRFLRRPSREATNA